MNRFIFTLAGGPRAQLIISVVFTGHNLCLLFALPQAAKQNYGTGDFIFFKEVNLTTQMWLLLDFPWQSSHLPYNPHCLI